MTMDDTMEIYVRLPEEGTPTMRPTRALRLESGLYRLLSTEDYDPEDEIWEFEPGSVVMRQTQYTDTGREIPVATRVPLSEQTILSQHPGAALVEIQVVADGTLRKVRKKTRAVALENGFYKILPTPDYDPQKERWEFSPGSVVKAVREKDALGNEALLAFDQIREDRMSRHYAQYGAK